MVLEVMFMRVTGSWELWKVQGNYEIKLLETFTLVNSEEENSMEK